MIKFNQLIAAAALTLLALTGTSKADALTQSYTDLFGGKFNVPLTGNGSTITTLSVNQFDDQGGLYTLDSVYIEFNTGITVSYSINATSTALLQNSGSLQLSGLGLNSNLLASYNDTQSVTNGKTVPVSATYTESSNTDITLISNLTNFIGIGTLSYFVIDQFNSNVTNSTNLSAFTTSPLPASFMKITYTYSENAIPEPSTYLLLGSMFGVVALNRRRTLVK